MHNVGEAEALVDLMGFLGVEGGRWACTEWTLSLQQERAKNVRMNWLAEGGIDGTVDAHDALDCSRLALSPLDIRTFMLTAA